MTWSDSERKKFKSACCWLINSAVSCLWFTICWIFNPDTMMQYLRFHRLQLAVGLWFLLMLSIVWKNCAGSCFKSCWRNGSQARRGSWLHHTLWRCYWCSWVLTFISWSSFYWVIGEMLHSSLQFTFWWVIIWFFKKCLHRLLFSSIT